MGRVGRVPSHCLKSAMSVLVRKKDRIRWTREGRSVKVIKEVSSLKKREKGIDNKKNISRLRMKTGRDRRWNLAYETGSF